MRKTCATATKMRNLTRVVLWAWVMVCDVWAETETGDDDGSGRTTYLSDRS